MNASPAASAPPPVLRRLGPPLAALAAAAVPAVYVSVVDPNAPGHYPSCPFLAATGWWCPGCGGLRCVHALTHGDLTAALHDNAVAVLLFAVLAVMWLRWGWAALGLGRADRRPAAAGVGRGAPLGADRAVGAGVHRGAEPAGRGGAGAAAGLTPPSSGGCPGRGGEPVKSQLRAATGGVRSARRAPGG